MESLLFSSLPLRARACTHARTHWCYVNIH